MLPSAAHNLDNPLSGIHTGAISLLTGGTLGSHSKHINLLKGGWGKEQNILQASAMFYKNNGMTLTEKF